MTKVLYIEVFKKCGPISSGDDFFDISDKFVDHKAFKKSPFSKWMTSSILGGSLHVYYSDEGKCVGVEVFPPLIPVLEDINLFDGDLKRIFSLLRKRNKVEFSDSGINCILLGVSIYSHDFHKDLNCSVGSVYVNLSGPISETPTV